MTAIKFVSLISISESDLVKENDKRYGSYSFSAGPDNKIIDVICFEK